MFKVGSHDPFRHFKHKLWPKEGHESNWQFESRPLKVRNRLDFIACRWRATYYWKVLDEGYNFAWDLISIGSLHTKLWESQLWEFRDSHLRVFGQNDIWVLVPWLGIEYTIRGKVVASPKSGPWWVMWVRVYPWFICAPKCCNYALTNLLFGLCKSMCEWLNCLSIFLVPSRSSNTPLYP
jgi:hypothetical protein